jgi:hypothetical protein
MNVTVSKGATMCWVNEAPELTEFERWWANFQRQIEIHDLSVEQITQAAWNAAKMRAGT